MSDESVAPYAMLRREVAERLCSFFAGVGDGRTASVETAAATASAQGPYRERNEDRCAVVRFRFGTTRTDLRLGILCDGMGGMARGDEAASLAISSFIAAFATIDTDCELIERLEGSCHYANKAVYNSYQGRAGTTLTAIALGTFTTCAVHVGDSRLYAIDADRNAELCTQDDTVSGAVNAHLGNDEEDDSDNRLLQFIGMGEGVTPHLLELSTKSRNVDSWLITSDGAHGVGRRVLHGVCKSSKNPLDLVRKLIFVSEAVDTHDNATALCVRAKRHDILVEAHEGLTLQISAPDRNLEIWLPQSVLQIARPDTNRDVIASPSEITPENVETVNAKALPKLVRPRKGRVVNRKRKTARQLDLDDPNDERPMDVIFEIRDEDD